MRHSQLISNPKRNGGTLMTLKQFITRAGAATTLLVAVSLVAMLLVVTAKQAVAGPKLIENCSSTAEEICKTVTYNDGADNQITVGEPITYTILITVHNGTTSPWSSTVVTDTFGSDLDVSVSVAASLGTANLNLTAPPPNAKAGVTQKWKLNWNIGTLIAGGTATLTLTAVTDINPGGNQEYTSCGTHVVNGGANLRFRNSANKSQSFNTGAITVNVVCP
jgi:fimbrial isopeptide formation D2 family protein